MLELRFDVFLAQLSLAIILKVEGVMSRRK
jgi:hypothetical protein